MKRKDVPQLGEQAKQSIPPLKVLNVPLVYQRQGGLDMEAAAKLEAKMNCTVEELLSSQDNALHFGDIAPKLVYGAHLVSQKRLEELPTYMRNLHQWYLDACKLDKRYIVANVPEEYYFRREDIHIEIYELW
jgi:hypothetical protein